MHSFLACRNFATRGREARIFAANFAIQNAYCTYSSFIMQIKTVPCVTSHCSKQPPASARRIGLCHRDYAAAALFSVTLEIVPAQRRDSWVRH